MSTLIKWFLRLVQVVFVLVLLAGVGGCYAAYLMFAPGTGPSERVFDIQPGTTLNDLALRLEDDKYIRNALAFRVLAKAVNMGGLQAGRYKLSASMSPFEILTTLKKGPQEEPGIMVTIPEGKTLREVAEILQERAGLPGRDFELLAITPRRLFPNRTWLPARATAEGFLYPDTYKIPVDARPSQVLDMMLTRFEEAALPAFAEARVPISRLMEKITLASLVEAEAQVSGERPRIASVYVNRMRYGMKLECDATVQYALGKRKPVLLYEDLKVESPYNTYLYTGLPPGPICNPGLSCIRAALRPAASEYLYYVRNDKKNDGSHVFSRSYAEHEQAIYRYQNP
ncbi:MAG: endolytic transglycosylase MltG [Armatimonadetes bacterium]|nr:endolytic transglycosylase MltG [Armatimonadota bacterium]